MQYLLRRVRASLLGTVSGEVLAAGLESGSGNLPYRRTLLGAVLAGFLAHVAILSVPQWHTPDSPWSNLIQVVLGALAFLAMLDASRRSTNFARRTWFLAALAMGAYTAGQAILTYYGVALYRSFSPNLKDQFFFLWVVPLLAAATADSTESSKGFDWTSILDFGQLLLLALALHLFVYGDSSRWLTHSQEMGFLKWKVRLIRDVVVLACLCGRAFVSNSRQTRELFTRLAIFYSAYTLAAGIYLYLAALRDTPPGTWLDLLWSVPRLLAVVLALTWNLRDEVGEAQPAPVWRRRFMLPYWAPIAVPLVVMALASRRFFSAPVLWTTLIVATFGIASLRLLATQFRQEQALSGLHASNNLLNSIFEGTSEVISLKDCDGRFRWMNSAGARFLGRSPADVVGKLDSDLVSGNSLERIRATDAQVKDSGGPVTSEVSLTINGVTRTFLSTKNPFRDAQGKITGVLAVALDVTERRNMEEQLRRAQRMESIGTFSGGIAHDFNNLLTVIKGYSQLALSEPEEHRQNQEYLEQINQAAGRASSLISQLLAFSRKQILQPRVISLNDVVTGLEKMLARLIGEDVEIQISLAHDLVAVKADPGQMEQVLMNLAANARDAMPAGGKLILETGNATLENGCATAHFNIPAGTYATLMVSDTGLGMDLETQARIFEPFFTTKPGGQGTGLGLSTVYGIVRQSGGYITVHSAPAAGAMFKVYLPWVSEPVEQVPTAVAPAIQPGSRQTVLLVDDDLQLRQLVETVLTKSGFTVLSADGGEEAQRISATHSGPIHLLLTDVVMPGVSGREVARRIREQRDDVQVLYMSGYYGGTIVHHGVPESGVCFLQKPFTPDRLLEKVRDALLGTAARQQNV
jgi:PAS domain S-box-containing protein